MRNILIAGVVILVAKHIAVHGWLFYSVRKRRLSRVVTIHALLGLIYLPCMLLGLTLALASSSGVFAVIGWALVTVGVLALLVRVALFMWAWPHLQRLSEGGSDAGSAPPLQ